MPVSGMTQKGERANMSIKEQLIRRYIDDEGNVRKTLPICAVCMNEISKYEIEAGMFEYVESKASKANFSVASVCGFSRSAVWSGMSVSEIV